MNMLDQTKNKPSRKQEIVETFVVFAVMTGLLLPVRLIFYTYVSTHWFGSFGLVSAISVLMVVLVKKKKLGRFGQMFENQMRKVQRGKRKILAYGQAALFLLLLGGTIVAIELGNSTYLDIKTQLLERLEGIDDPQKMLAESKKMTPQDWITGFAGFVLAIFFAFPQISALLAILNEMYAGWLLHFYTVALVETLEMTGILIFYRITLSREQNNT
ncbi:MAG TPA: hypothetical protein HA319_02455 [Nitrosopumilaceae archaeon]|nr:hypothetical protein [Nitrosopumilaceae archaeon]